MKVEIPANPHLWHERADDLRTIRRQARALAEASDLDAARRAYGVLSDALDRVVSAIGVPDGYEINHQPHEQGHMQGGQR